MAKRNATLSVRFFKIILQTILQRLDNIIDHSDDESIEILDEWLKRKKNKQRLPIGRSPRPHKKVRGETENTTKRNSSLNWPKEAKAQKVAAKFNSCNHFFTILIKPYHLCVPSLEGVIENKDKNVILQIGKRSWNLKLLSWNLKNGRRFSAGWYLFARESGLQPGDEYSIVHHD
ncbi:hypothetical protein TSUD_127700 [Trifolium subterraneum]|nr:hypothetical protein TSUD_127700 [Trifolium subterraneum]